MALTDAQAKIIAQNKKKKEEEEARKLAAAMLVNAAKPKASSFPTVTPSKVVTNQVTTPLKQGKPATQRTTTRKTTSLLSDMGSRDQSILDRMRSDSGRLYTPIDVIRDRISIGDTAQTLAYRARQQDNDSWQERLQKAAEERIKRQEELSKYTLSEADQNLPSHRKQMVLEAKDAWQKAKDAGDLSGMSRAHQKAESVRGWAGYSGGAAGDEFIEPQLTQKDRRTLTEAGQNRLKKALLDRQKAIQAGDLQAQMKASEKIVAIRNDPASLRQPTVGKESLDAHGRSVERDRMTAERFKDAEHRFQEGLYSTMAAVPGSVLSFLETTNQAIDNDMVEKNRAYLQEKANKLYEYQVKLEMVRNGEGSPEWGSESWLEQQVRIAQNAQRLLTQGTIVDPNLPGQTLMRESQAAGAEALEGVEGWKRDLAEAAMSMGQMIPSVALSMIPGVGPALGLGLMGTQAAGSRAWELNEQNSQANYLANLKGGDPEDYGAVDPAHSSFRGLLSGIVEAGTGFIPMGKLTKLLKGKGGTNLVRNILEQMGMEGAEEGVAYTANFLLDKAAQDPNAEWTPEELWHNVKLGALAGGMMAAPAQIIGSGLSVSQPQERTVESVLRNRDTQVEGEQKASDNKTSEAKAVETKASDSEVRTEVRTEARTAQEAAEEPVEAPRLAEATVPAETRMTQLVQTREAQVTSPAIQQQEQQKKGKQVKLKRIDGIPAEVEVVQTAPVEDPATLVAKISTLGENGQKALKAARPDQGVAQYTSDFIRVYNQAFTGTNISRIQAPDSMTDAQVIAAHDSGKRDRELSLASAREATKYAAIDNKAGMDFETSADYIATMDKQVVSELDSMAKMLGVRVQMVDSVKGGEANADIQGSVVRIEKGNPHPVRFLFGHEMTHRVQELAPESYREFRDFVMSSPKAQDEVQRKLAAYKSRGVDIDSEGAIDEIVADYAGQLIESKDLMKRFIDQNRKNQSMLSRFLTALKDLATKLTGRRKAQVNDAVALLEKAVGDAAKQAKKLDKNKNTARADGAKYSINEGFAGEIAAWNRNGRPDGETFVLGETGPVLQGLGAIESDIYMNGDKIKKIFKDHPEMGIREIQRIPEILEDPVLVLASKRKGKKGNNSRVVIYGSIKAQNGQPFMAVLDLRPTESGLLLDDMQKVNSSYTKKNAASFVSESDAMYVDKKRTTSLLRQFGLTITSRELLRSGYIGSIAYEGKRVNLTGVPFSEIIREQTMVEPLENANISYDPDTESASPARYSLKTWTESSYVRDRDKAAKAMSEVLGISQKKAKQYIDDVNSIAKMIADDRVRLDYDSAPGKSSFVSNAEYGGSIDFSTICKKRRLFTGTFEAIQEALPNTALTAEEFLEIRTMMAEKGHEVSCGLCYVEGSRANMGQYTKQFIERYAATNPAYVPNMAEMNTATGQEKIRREHPEVYEAYEYFMNHYGRLKPTDKALFASQQKPKMYQMSTEYKGEVLDKFGKKSASVEEKNANGGLRLQSFSDFEIVHLIDSMQVIMDMSRVGLAGQAYTKVPDFAWALGDTGLKINLSLIAKGVDSKGNLILDEVEGMAEADAMALRKRYSDNVGTIIVVFTDRQLMAAMSDERIDYIIPFHRSQWKTDQYEAMGLPKNAKDFTSWQNEAYIEPVYNKNGKKQRPENYMPNNYWNFRKSGKANAEAYLKMCAENNRRPKFHYLLDKKADGSYALKKDGSTDGYWKLLIDFKMYNNDGKGVPQKPVKPNFNMEQAERMLNEYTGVHSKFPAAQDVVDEFVAKYKEKNPGVTYSLKGISGYENLVEKFGAIEQGEDPRARDIQVPKQTEEGKKVSRTVRTILEAGSTTDEMVPTIKKMVEDGEFSYEVAGDKAAIETAEAIIRDKGFQAALMDWTSSLAKGEVNKQNVATGWALYDAAAQAGDAKTAADIMTRIVIHQRNAAQAVQATRILKRMSPSAQLYGIQRSVQNMQEELTAKYGDKAPNLKVPDELIERYLNAENQEERDEAEIEIYKSIGKQMPSTFQDKWNAWRYLAMLFNVRTHLRNITGNAVFAIPVSVKNVVGTVVEGGVSVVSGGKVQRTKGVATPDLVSAAWADYKKAEPQIMAGGKYDDSAAKKDIIQDNRVIFRTRFVEWLRKMNSGALQAEDGWACRPHYANALAQYCAANGITAEQIRTGEGVDKKAIDKARGYAIREAQKATFRDFNDFSNYISSLGRYEGKSPTRKAVSVLTEGLFPFRKTPANIMVRAVEYSPANLANVVAELVYNGVMARKGKTKEMIPASQIIDNFASGLTGTGLFVFGVYLASQGLLIASEDDDDKQADFDKLLGRQTNAIERKDGSNFTIDWMAPQVIPVLMGAELFQIFRENDGSASWQDLINAISTVTNPMLELSCLSSLNDTLDALTGFVEGDVSSLVTVAVDIAVGYLTQGIPTLFGQGERSSQEERMTTYTDKNLDTPPDWQYTIGQISAKIPGWDYNQIPYIDAWGRTENEGTLWERILSNFINPAYTSKYAVSNMEAELQRLYDATGEGVFPQRAERKLTINGTDVDLTAEQYIQYATLKGKESQRLLVEMTSSSWYAALGDAEKAQMISDALAVARESAKLAVFPEYESKNTAFLKASSLEEDGIPTGEFLMMYGIAQAQESSKTVDDETISDSLGYNKLMALRNSGMLDKYDAEQQKKILGAVDVGGKLQSMSEDALAKLATDIEEQMNAPSFYSNFPDGKRDLVKGLEEYYESATTEYDSRGKQIDGKGKQDKFKAEIRNKVNSGELTAHEAYLVFHRFYDSDKNNPWAYAKNG